jgi:hypothetical protein
MSTELILIAVLGSGLALWAAQAVRLWVANRQLEESVESATIIEKALVHEPGSGWEPDQRHVLVFALPDGSHRNFAVTESLYKQVHAGQSGQLHTRGSWFCGFERDSGEPPKTK